MSKNKYNFYMQQCDKDGNLINLITLKNLEQDFVGLRYSSIEGMESFGKPKNIEVETYADSEKDRVYVPEKVNLESTKVTLNLYFIGEKRFEAYNKFVEYIKNGFHRYWDDARNRYFVFYFNNAVTLEDSNWKGIGYFKVAFTLSNIFGQTFPLNE